MKNLGQFVIKHIQKTPPSDIPRVNIGIFGKMNVGKSLLTNKITQHETSIVDSTPGTTADVKIAMLELHDIGPIKLFDTPGTDEFGELGGKKRTKAMHHLDQCDMVVLVINPENGINDYEKEIVKKVDEEDGQKLVVLYNIFEGDDILNLDEKIEEIEEDLNLKEKVSGDSLVINLSNGNITTQIHEWIEKSYSPEEMRLKPVDPLPPTNGSCVFLNIPMDELTPAGRLLRPQAIVQEHCIRNYLGSYCYRMNLTKARSSNEKEIMEEKERFLHNLLSLRDMGCELLVTDSQAMDIIGPWTLDENNEPIIDITTFSISMANLMSSGNLEKFIEGVSVFDSLQKGDKVLIVEACTHNRIQDDIGTVQIPGKIEEKYGDDIGIDFAFGKGYSAIDLDQYKLAIHCGGCMLDRQTMHQRIKDIEKKGIPITNYGLLLSYFESKRSLERVIQPWIEDFTLSD